ncbi:MAG: DUF1214 domain-containing protein [Steroidobacteraceae bacterium]
MSEKTTPLLVGCALAILPAVSLAADDTGGSMPQPAETAAVSLPAWESFADELKGLGQAMMLKLPERLRDDPQTQQEAGRLLLGALAARTLDALASDGDHPLFLPWIGATLNVLQPNVDTIYKKAVITPGGTYRIRGDRGSLRIFKMAQVYTFPEETGKVNPGIGVLTFNDFNTLRVDSNGRFDVILSPSKPKGHTGDWWELNPRAHGLLLRLVAYDWSTERDPRLAIERLDAPVTRPRPSADDLEQRLRSLALLTGNTALILADHVEGLRREGTINALKEWNVGGATLSKVGGLVGQFYYEGAYELAAEEALIFETKVPEKCHYWSVILTNDLYETTDWYNQHSSINGAQAHIDSDGMFRVVISAADPGVPNWLDTSGYPTGALQGRWTDCSENPIPKVRKVPIAEIRNHLPRDTPQVTAAQREQVIRERRAQLQWRVLW